jgi:MipA family protein
VTHQFRFRSDLPRFNPVSCLNARLFSGAALTAFCCCPLFAQDSQPGAQDQQKDAQTGQPAQPVQTIQIEAERQTALDAEAMTVSETPDAGPQRKHLSMIVGLGPFIGPVYDGSRKSKVRPFPYVDIRGLLDGRVFASSLDGLGVNLVSAGPLRAGLSVNQSGGRTSSDDAHLKGLPDISDAARAGGFVAYSFRPFAVEMKVDRRIGSNPGTQASLGASYGAAPLPDLHLSLSADLTWADAAYQKAFFGVTPAEAAQATADGNRLRAYTPGAGLSTVGFTAAGVYQLGGHWGLVARLGLHDLIGPSGKDSPLTQRTFQPNFAVGALYKF